MTEPVSIITSRYAALITVIILIGCILNIIRISLWKRTTTLGRIILLLTTIIAATTILIQLPVITTLLSPIPLAPHIDGSTTLAKLVAATPAPYLRGLTLVTDDQKTLHFLIPSHFSAIGTYIPASRSIWLDKSQEFDGVWLHEIGHHLWYYHLTDAERATFTTLHTTAPPTNYSTTSVEEDFAESFSVYNGAMDGMLDSPRWHFINNVTTRQIYLEDRTRRTIIIDVPEHFNHTVIIT
jgi:hypothetical protein